MDGREHCSFCNSTTGKHTQLVCGDNLCEQCVSVFSISGGGNFECPVCGTSIQHETVDIGHLTEEAVSSVKQKVPHAEEQSLCSLDVSPLQSAPCAKNDDYTTAQRENIYMSMRKGWTEEPTIPLRAPTLPPRKPNIPTGRFRPGTSPSGNLAVTRQQSDSLLNDTYFIHGMSLNEENADVQIEGPVLPPRMNVPSSALTQSLSVRENDVVSELSSYGRSEATEPILSQLLQPSLRRSNTDTTVDYGDRRKVVNLSSQSLTHKTVNRHLVEEIGEKYNLVDKLASECKNRIAKITKASLGIEDAINESHEASMQNINAIEKKLLKEVKVVSTKEDGDAEIVHNVHQTFISLTREANDISAGTMSGRDIIKKGILVSQQLNALLGREFLNDDNEKVVFMENYLNLSVGSLSKRLQKFVGLVGLSDKFALMVADRRDTLGVCLALWSKTANRCVKWEVAFQPKDTKTVVVVSPNLGCDGSGSSIMVTAIDETLYIKQSNHLFSDEAGTNCAKNIRLKLGSHITSLACVEGKPNYVAISCHKADGSVYIYDFSTDQLMRKLSLSKDISFHVAFAAMFDSVLQFGILLKERSRSESLSIVEENGNVRQTMSEISVETNKVIPYIVRLNNSNGELEIGVLFWDKLAACRFTMGKFDFRDMKPTSASAQLVVTQGQIPVNMTSLPGTSSYLLSYINGQTLLLTP